MGTASISAGPRLLGLGAGGLLAGLGAAGLPLAQVVAQLELALPQEQHHVPALVLAERDLILERLGHCGARVLLLVVLRHEVGADHLRAVPTLHGAAGRGRRERRLLGGLQVVWPPFLL